MSIRYFVVHFDVLGGYLGQRFFRCVTQTSLKTKTTYYSRHISLSQVWTRRKGKDFVEGIEKQTALNSLAGNNFTVKSNGIVERSREAKVDRRVESSVRTVNRREEEDKNGYFLVATRTKLELDGRTRRQRF